MSTRDRWNQIEKLFQSALELDEQRRRAFLDDACAGEPGLRSEVESLLGYSASAGDFMETPALAAGYIGPYRLIKVIATGGMGVVYEAEQQNPRRVVALKVVRGGEQTDEHRILLFQREAESLARLKHPGIASIYDAGCTENRQHYFAMELVNGEMLTDHVRTREIPLRQRLELFGKLCDAISYAHQRGVIHRDLKPSNILVTDGKGEQGPGSSSSLGVAVKVLDFGLARITGEEVETDTTISGTGQIMGTLRYMSPEQTRGKMDEIDVRTDVYSLGMILYELLTDRLPYNIDSLLPHEAFKAICERPPARPASLNRDLRGDIETIILKAIEKDPAQRYQGVAEFNEDINRYLEGQPILAHPASSLYQLKKLVLRHKVFVGFTGTVLSLMLVLLVVVATFLAKLSNEHRGTLLAKANETSARMASERIADFLDTMLSSAHPDNARGREVTVREVVDAAAARIESELADQPRVAAAVRDTIGKTYHSLGLHDEAEKHLRMGLSQRTSLFGDDYPDVVNSLNHLAMLLIDKSNYQEAEELCQRALDVSRRIQEGDHALLAKSLNSWASLLRAKGDFEAGERYFREALRIRQSLLGDKHRDVATSLNNLATLLHEQANYGEAEKLFRKALAMRIELLGELHPDVANSMNNLAMFLWEQGAYSAAEPLFENVLILQRTLVGDRHQLVAATLNNLGLVRKAMGKLGEAESLFREAMEIQEDVLGTDHPDLAETMNNLATLLYARRDLAGAEPLLREALAMRRSVLGETHPSVAKNLNDLAALFYAREDLDAAEPMYRQALDMYIELVGEDHPRVGLILNNLGSLKRAQGDFREARAFYERSIENFQKTLPHDHPHQAGPVGGLGSTLAEAGEPRAAEPYLRRAREIQLKTLPPHHWRLIQTEHILGRCLIDAGRFEEAEKLLLATYARLPAPSEGRNAASARATVDLLVLIYERWQKPAKAGEFRDLLARLPDASGE